MADHFRDDDAGYIRWSRDHPGGYVVPKKEKDFSIHRSQCGYVDAMGAGYQLTHLEKIWSVDPDRDRCRGTASGPL